MSKKLTCIASLVLALGCKTEAEKSSDTATKSEATAAVSSAPVLDTKIASAVAQAAKTQGQNAEASDGPPEDGILGLTRADSEVPKGSKPYLKLGSAGSEPRVVLGASDWGDNRSGQLELSVRTGAGMIPTTTLKFEVRRAPAGAPGTTAPNAAPANTTASTASPPLNVASPSHILNVVSSELAATQPAEIPPALAAEIRKLKGGQFGVYATGEGLIGTPSARLAAGANPQLESLMQAGAVALTDAVPVFPKEPVGSGAFWLVKSRETLFDTDVVAYRMVKLAELNGNQAVLDISTKRYLADGSIGLPGLEQATVRQYQAEGSTQLTIAVGSALPLDGRTQTSLRTYVEIEGQPRPVQLETRSLFTFSPTGPAK